MVTSDPPVTEREKREALEAVVSSSTFARSAQLRTLLRHICERDLAGRAEELTEHQIAVDVLGRRKDDLTDDAAVRNRAYELRQRLEKYYSSEQPGAAIRIEIPRGGYVPLYTRPAPLVAVQSPAPLPAPVATPILETEVIVAAPRGFRAVYVGVALLVILAAIAGFLLRPVPGPSPILREAWGPLTDTSGDLLLVIATNMHMIVRPHIQAHPRRLPAPQEAYLEYGSHRPLAAGTPLYMEPAQLSVPLGELSAAVTLANARSAFGGATQVLSEAEAPVAALRGRNGVLIGSGTNSESARALLRNLPYTIDYTEKDEFAVLDQRAPSGKNQLFLSQPSGYAVGSTLYGLISVITSPDLEGKPRRTLVVSGAGSAGVQAAVEYFCSPVRMQELKDRLRAAGLKTFPPVYQVVVRAKTSGIRLLSYEYAGHVVAEHP